MVEHLLNKYRSELIEAFKLLDGIIDTSLIGSATNSIARRLILLGACLSGIGAIGLIAGPGLIVFEIGAGMSVLSGLSSIVSGLIVGYKSSRAKTAQESSDQVYVKIAESHNHKANLLNILKDIFITS